MCMEVHTCLNMISEHVLKPVHEVEDTDGGLDAPMSRQEAWSCPRGETETCEMIIVRFMSVIHENKRNMENCTKI